MIQKLKLHRGQILTKDNISKLLSSARGTFGYAKFTMYNGIYISVYFSKDLSTELVTNSRDISLWNRMEILRRNSTLSMITDFLFYWIQALNK